MEPKSSNSQESQSYHLKYYIGVTNSSYRIVFPFVASIVVYMLMLHLINSDASKFLEALQKVLNTRDTSDTVESYSHLYRPFAWTSSALVLSSLFIATILISLLFIWQTLKEFKFRTFPVFILLLLASVFLSFLSITAEPFLPKILHQWMLHGKEIIFPDFIYVINFLSYLVIILLILAFCLLSAPLSDDINLAKNQLIRRNHSSTVLIYIGAFTLAFTVVEINLLYSLPGNAGSLGVIDLHLHAIAAGMSTVCGAFFSILLLAMFVPTAIILHSEAYRVAAKLGNAYTIEELNSWLKSNDLEKTTGQQATKLLIIFGPFITSWIGEPIANLLSSLGGT